MALLIARRPLRDREGVLSSDVADALEALVRGGSSLPIAFDKATVVDQLVIIANTSQDGVVARPPIAVRRALTDLYSNRLTNSSVFQAGYKHYEQRTSLPVVPVTDFFFKVIYAGGDTAECLDAMSEHEIMNSLPKRRGRVRVDENDAEYLRDEDSGEVLRFGELAGVVVFPANSHDALLRTWLQRRASITSGHVKGAVSALEHARPESAAVEHLKEKTMGLSPAMRKALPTPKRP